LSPEDDKTGTSLRSRKRADHSKEKAHGRGQGKVRWGTYEHYANLCFDRVPYPSPIGIKTLLESVAKENPTARGADACFFTDPGLSRTAGFIKSLYD
jgi:hypothetical protein